MHLQYTNTDLQFIYNNHTRTYANSQYMSLTLIYI
nr:MAG TPA: hypothetical protein [Caudoviricetes sp.]